MIQGIGHDDDGPLILLGLSSDNLVRLGLGQPIDVKMTVNGTQFRIMVMTGETEQAMVDELRRVGLFETQANP